MIGQAPPGSRSYSFAADQGQARLLLDAVEGFVRRSPALARLVEVLATRVIVRATGATLDAFAADRQAGAWGLRPFFAVADELAQWATTAGPRRIWEAVASAMPKTGGTLVVATTAGSPGHWAAKRREHALTDPLWRVSETHGPPPWMPPHLVEGQRRLLPEQSFLRLFENRWVSGDEDLVSAEDLAAAALLDGPLNPFPASGT